MVMIGASAHADVVAHYTFDNTLADSGANGLDLTTGSGSANYAAGKFGQAVDCINPSGGSGTGNYHYNASTLFDFGTGDFAVAFWYQSDHVNGVLPRPFDIGQLVTKDNHTTANPGWGLRVTNDGALNPFLGYLIEPAGGGNTVDFSSTPAPADDNTVYHHLVLQRNGDNMESWLDGVLLDSTPGVDNVNVTAPGYAFAVGARGVLSSGGLASGGGYGLDGRIDELWVFDAALSEDQIKNQLMTLNTLIMATNPSPANGATGVDPAGLSLSWTAPVGGPYTYDVYLSTPSDPNIHYVDTVSGTSYTPSPELALQHEYKWRVDPKSGGSTYPGSVWTFTTGGGVSNPSPYDGSENQGYDMVLLSWDATLASSYDVYFGTDPEALGSPTNTTETQLPVDVDPNALYYWKVDTKDAGGSLILAGDVWSFSTGLLLGHWNLDDGSGTVALDSSGNGYDATVNEPNTHWTTGVIRGGIWYPPIDTDPVAATRLIGHDLGSVNQLSYSLWFKRSANSNPQYLWRNADWTTTTQVYHSPAVNALRVEVSNDDFNTGVSASPDVWHHLVVTHDVPSGVVRLYLDGAEAATSTRSSMAAITLPEVRWGERVGGPMDDVWLFNAVLSPQEVADLYDLGAIATDPSPQDGIDYVETDVVCQWTPGFDITSQVFQIDDDADFSSPLEEVSLSDTDNSRDPLNATDLDFGTTYYWRVNSVQDSGTYTIEGTTWSFTTIPPIASEPDPVNGATDVAQNKVLGWLAGANFNAGTGDTHQVYIAAGTAEGDLPGTPTAEVTSESYDPVLEFETQYVWRVDEYIDGTTYTGNLWTFTTGTPICDPPLLADTNGDCVVDMRDFAQFALEWLDCTLANGDCP